MVINVTPHRPRRSPRRRKPNAGQENEGATAPKETHRQEYSHSQRPNRQEQEVIGKLCPY